MFCLRKNENGEESHNKTNGLDKIIYSRDFKRCALRLSIQTVKAERKTSAKKNLPNIFVIRILDFFATLFAIFGDFFGPCGYMSGSSYRSDCLCWSDHPVSAFIVWLVFFTHFSKFNSHSIDVNKKKNTKSTLRRTTIRTKVSERNRVYSRIIFEKWARMYLSKSTIFPVHPDVYWSRYSGHHCGKCLFEYSVQFCVISFG